jgi:hypothetical protein
MRIIVVMIVFLAVPASGGAASTSGPPPGLSGSGRVLWNFEALLHDTFGNQTVCVGPNVNFSPKYCGYGTVRYYADVFASARHSTFHLTRKAPRFVPPHHWTLVRVRGRFVACNARESMHLIFQNDSENFALKCREPGG